MKTSNLEIMNDIIKRLDDRKIIKGADTDSAKVVRNYINSGLEANIVDEFTNYNTALRVMMIRLYNSIKGNNGYVNRFELRLLESLERTLKRPNECIIQREVEPEYE